MVGNVTTATEYSSGTTANFRVAKMKSCASVGLDSHCSGAYQFTFGNKTQCSFGTNEETVEVVSGRTLPRPPSGLYDLPIRKDHSQIDDPVLHSPIFYCISP